MNKKQMEAEEFVAKRNYRVLTGEPYESSVGIYLAALKGPSVNKLVKALENIRIYEYTDLVMRDLISVALQEWYDE